jgi:hypothetical protein
MKNLLVVLMATLADIYGCKKKEPEPTNIIKFDFNANGVHDLTIKSDDSVTFSIEVTAGVGWQDSVELYGSALPKDVQLKILPNKNIPTYSSNLVFASKLAKPGTYQMQLFAKNEDSSLKKKYDYSLKIVTDENCAKHLEDSFTSGWPGKGHYTNKAVVYQLSKDSIYISSIPYGHADQGFYDGGPMIAVVNCADNSVIIPQQTATMHYPPFQISGTGYFDSKIIYLKYNMYDEPNHSITLTRK